MTRPDSGLPPGLSRERAGTYSFTVDSPLGELGAARLAQVAAIVDELGLSGVKITAGQRLRLSGIPESALDDVRARLGEPRGMGPFFVQACPGNTACRLGLRDSLSLGRRIEELVAGRELPAKLKAGVSGCPKCCAESLVRDVGLVARNSGWLLAFGGNAGARPRTADVLARGLDDEAALAAVDRLLVAYARLAEPGERCARLLERLGPDTVRAEAGLD